MHLLKGVRERVFPVGRLDYSSEGLLLLTTDGEFANRITSPAGHVEKVYVVKANGHLTEQQMEDFRQGIPLHGRRTAPAHINLIRQGDNPWYEVRLTEGRQNQIRIMFQHFHRLVEKLRRVKIGFLTLSGLEPGMWRYLEARETERMLRMVRLEPPARRPGEHAAGHRQPREPQPLRASQPAPPPAPEPERRQQSGESASRGPASTNKRPPKPAWRPRPGKFTPRGPASQNKPPQGPPRRAPAGDSVSRGAGFENKRTQGPSQRPPSGDSASRGPAPRDNRPPRPAQRPPSGDSASRGPAPRDNRPPRPAQRPPSGESRRRGPASQDKRASGPPSPKSSSRRPGRNKDRR